MSEYKHPQIRTKDSQVETGKDYTFKEDSYIAEVRVLGHGIRADGVFINFEILRENHPLGRKTCEVWAANHDGGYSGMWRLHDFGEYIFNVKETS